VNDLEFHKINNIKPCKKTKIGGRGTVYRRKQTASGEKNEGNQVTEVLIE